MLGSAHSVLQAGKVSLAMGCAYVTSAVIEVCGQVQQLFLRSNQLCLRRLCCASCTAWPKLVGASQVLDQHGAAIM